MDEQMTGMHSTKDTRTLLLVIHFSREIFESSHCALMYFWLVKYRNEMHENKSLPYLNPRPTHTPDPFSRFDGLHFVLIVLVTSQED